MRIPGCKRMLRSRLQRWRNDAHLGRVFKNFGLLVSGRGVAGLLALGTLALMGRGLTPEEFGTVVLIQTLAMTAKGLLKIDPWAAVIHYGVNALRCEDQSVFKRLVGYTFGVDLVSAVLAAITVMTLTPLGAKHFGWNPHILILAQLYGSFVFLSVESTPLGILRLFNRYDLLSLQGLVRPLLRLTGVATAYLIDAGLSGYLLAWYASNLAHNISLMLVARHELRRNISGRLWVGIHPQQVHRECPHLWRYMLALYWQSLLDLVQKNLATLFMGGLFGSKAAGLYRVAWDMANVLSKPVWMLRQSILPDLARLWQNRDRAFRRLTLRSGLLAGSAASVIFVIVIFAGGPLIGAVMGDAYVEAATLLTLLVLAGTLDLYGFALRPAGYAMGRPGVIVKINSVATVLYLILLFGFSSSAGLLAPGLAAMAAALLSLVSLSIAIVRMSRMPREPAQP